MCIYVFFLFFLFLSFFCQTDRVLQKEGISKAETERLHFSAFSRFPVSFFSSFSFFFSSSSSSIWSLLSFGTALYLRDKHGRAYTLARLRYLFNRCDVQRCERLFVLNQQQRISISSLSSSLIYCPLLTMNCQKLSIFFFLLSLFIAERPRIMRKEFLVSNNNERK